MLFTRAKSNSEISLWHRCTKNQLFGELDKDLEVPPCRLVLPNRLR